MATIQMVIDDDLLQAADLAAQRARINRSALLREALRVYLLRQKVALQELQDRLGYERHPDTEGDLADWEQVAEWPET